MERLLRWLVPLCALAVLGRAAAPIVQLSGLEKSLTFTAEEFAALPHTEIKVLEPHDKKERTYSGISLHDLLVKLGAPVGESFRGPALQLGVIVRSKDNYAVLFSLAEFDENFSTRTILLCDREEGQPTPDNAAPLRLVVPGDKRAARWSRHVASVEIISIGETVTRTPKS